MKTDYRKLLTDKQWEAVSHINGPLLILAGAGSGKTRVITYRICNLIENHNVNPYRILAMTFTNKASKEMKERVEGILGQTATKMNMGTFHSMCVKILRLNLQHIGMDNRFIIFDGDDQLKLIKIILKELDYDSDSFDPRGIASRISNWKNERLSASDIEKRGRIMDIRLSAVYREYEKQLRKQNALDFDDLLLYTVKLFEKADHVLKSYQSTWQYIMIDEFQDTNVVQMDIIKLLGSKHKNICVVGDDDQSIYGWRGADVSNILDFDKLYKGTKVVKLEQNYRSTKNILKVASTIIKNNQDRTNKTLWTENNTGKPVFCFEGLDERDEADFVARSMNDLLHNGAKYGHMAILYRTNAQSRSLEESLQRYRIPYRIVGGLKFYDRKEVKDILAYLKFIHNQKDTFSLLRIINTPVRGLGKKSINKVIQLASEHDTVPFDEIDDIIYRGTFPKGTTENLKKFKAMMNEFISEKDKVSLSELVEDVINISGYKAFLKEKDKEEVNRRLDNVMELLSATQEFELTHEKGDLEAYLDHVALLTDIDKEDENDRAVTLMTLHSSKGLEFPYVFMVGLEQNILPHIRSLNTKEELEEERRLCYVGITRAQKQLCLSYVTSRSMFGKTVCNQPSMFIEELPEDCIEVISY